MQRFTEYLFKHRWQTLALTFLWTFLPIIGTLSILPAALITLRKGAVEGAVFTLAATLPYLATLVHVPPQMTSTIIWVAVGALIFSNFLTWMFALSLHQQKGLSQVLQWAALLGMLLVSLVHLIFPNVMQWWEPQLLAYFNQTSELFSKLQNNTAAPVSQIELVNAIKYYFTGFIVAGMLLNAFIQLLIARWWEAAVFKTKSLRRDLCQIRLNRLFGLFFLSGLVLSYLGNLVALDIMPILYVLFAMAGLSLLHYVIAQSKTSKWFWIFLVYMGILLLLPFSVACVAGVGLLDVWFDFRSRLGSR